MKIKCNRLPCANRHLKVRGEFLLFLPYFVKLCGFYLVLTDTDSLERLESWKGYFHIPASK